MEAYAKQAKELGDKYGCNDPMGFMMNVMTNPKVLKRYDKEMTELLQGRISCCKKHGRNDERIKYEQSLAKHRAIIG